MVILVLNNELIELLASASFSYDLNIIYLIIILASILDDAIKKKSLFF